MGKVFFPFGHPGPPHYHLPRLPGQLSPPLKGGGSSPWWRGAALYLSALSDGDACPGTLPQRARVPPRRQFSGYGGLRIDSKPRGSLLLATVAAYSPGRFFNSRVRDEPAVPGPLHESPSVSPALLAMAVGSLACWKVRLLEPESLAGPREAAP